MAMTLQEFVSKTNAEIVGGRIIVGVMKARMHVGESSPVFSLNADGQAIQAELESGIAAEKAMADVVEKKTAAKRGKTVEPITTAVE